MTAVSSVSYLPSLSQVLTLSLSLEKKQHVCASGKKKKPTRALRLQVAPTLTTVINILSPLCVRRR